jgi:predicted RNase H-like nuclease
MDFIGIDLAWGQKNGTGVCHARHGQVISSDFLRSDDQIVDWLRPKTRKQDVLVAVDAPLIVTNPSGRRLCEAQISRCFCAFEAGAHSSSRRRPEFSDGGRGQRLLALLNLPIASRLPDGGPVSQAIEVYPHPALVSLFALSHSLKYKKKTGRTIEYRQSEFARLVDLLESLTSHEPALDVTTAPHWEDLKQAVCPTAAGAPLSSHNVLDRAEDELDAFVCAYTALYYWTHRLDRCRIAGTDEEGFIVTPVTAELGTRFDQIAGIV